LTDRITFLEETLVAPDARRGGDLIRTFGMSMQDLLELAISHELGHGLCALSMSARLISLGSACGPGTPAIASSTRTAT
jgi:hypothetical protein